MLIHKGTTTRRRQWKSPMRKFEAASIERVCSLMRPYSFRADVSKSCPPFLAPGGTAFPT